MAWTGSTLSFVL